MISFFEASITQLSVHHIGNKTLDEHYALSDRTVSLKDELLDRLLIQYFLTPFEKINELFRFFHHNNDLEMNEIYHFAKRIFDNKESFHEQTQEIAKHLYEISNHPKIKSGELYVAILDQVQIDGELCDAIGIFKSENKETYLRIKPVSNGFDISYEQNAININRLDKGCLIFNAEEADGFKIAIVDSTNRNQEAVYWKDEFLKIKIRNNNFNQTNAVLGVYKNFVTQKLDDEFEVSKTDKIDLLNRSMKYFKEKETFDLNEFTSEVIGNEQGIASFLNYKKGFEEEFETPIADSFEIHDTAVKKQARVYKSVLKLDKNFHIYIHGDKQLIEKGFDEEKSMNYYKVYFKQEE